MLGAGSLFGSIFNPLLPQSSWLYNPFYHTHQYILEPEWHALALRVAQQRLQDPSRLEDLRKAKNSSRSLEDDAKNDSAVEADDPNGLRETSSPDGSIEVDDKNDPDSKTERNEDSSQDLESPKASPCRSEASSFRDVMSDESSTVRLKSNFENQLEGEQDLIARRGDLTVKIRLEGTVDLSTKRSQGKENVGQDLTVRRKDEDIERNPVRSRRDRSPKPRHVWRPY